MGEVMLHSFCPDFPHCQDGDLPKTGVNIDPTGNLYENSNAETFQLTPDSASPLVGDSR